MKFRTEVRQRTVMHGPAGQERPVQETYTVRVPVMPRNWDSIAIKFAASLVLTLTLIAVAWSTVSIGALLHGVIGYAAASLFDLAWLVNILLEWLARNDPKKRKFSRRMGWALLGVTMGAIAWHGALHSIPMAVVGALVSAFAKLLWMGIMHFINRDLNDLDQQWVAGEMSKANAVLAMAGVRRQVAEYEAQAALEILAAEQTRQEVAGLMDPETAPEPVQASAETISDAVTPRRRDAISPTGEEADIRPELETAQAKGQEKAPALRAEDFDLLRKLLADHDAQQNEPEDDEEDDQPRVSIANGVRTLVKNGVTDPKVVAAALPALIGYQPKPETVSRELRAAKARLAEALKPSDSGLYL